MSGEFEKIKLLASEMAEATAITDLMQMFVEPGEAARRVASHKKEATQDWIELESQMIRALMALESLGYVWTKDGSKS